jgi:hypothetical protein
MIDRNGTYVIRGCLRDADSSDDYENRCVRRLDNQAEQASATYVRRQRKKATSLRRSEMRSESALGQCLLVQNSDPTADENQLWCCRTVNCTEYKLRSADMGMDYGG